MKRFSFNAMTAGTAAAALLSFLALTPVGAEEKAEPLLRLVAASGAEKALTRADLDALPQHEFDTATLWTEGVSHYAGPSLHDVLALGGISTEESFVATASNDYHVVFEGGQIEEDYPIVATLVNGKPYSLRERGPLWVIYPYDSDTRYQTEVAYSQSIWQLVTLSAGH